MARTRGRAKVRKAKLRGVPGGSAAEKILRLNLAAIKAHRPELLDVATGPVDPRRVRIERDAEGRVVNLYRKNSEGTEVAWHTGPPEAEMDDLWASVDWQGVSMATLMGLGYGAELSRMLSGHDVLVRRLMVIEPDVDVFRMALRTTPMSAAFAQKHVPFFVGMDLPALAAAVFDFLKESSNIRYVKTMTVVLPEGSLRFEPDYTKRAISAVRRSAVESLTFMGNAPQDSLLGLEHMLTNLGIIVDTPALADLIDSFRGKPAFVASAGPSLPKAFPVLRELQEEVLILCPDTSLKPLLQAGIRPHLVCSRERTPRTAKLFTDVVAPDTWLAAAPLLHPTCFRAYDGPVVSIFRKAGHFPWLGLERGALDFNGSAGNMAFRLAEEMGCGPIILVGQDLAFGSDGGTHVGGAATGSKQSVYDTMKKVSVPGNRGVPVLTTPMWLGFLRRYEYDVANYDGLCINATDGGAMIRGAAIQDLDSVVRDHLPGPTRMDVRARLRELLEPPSAEQSRNQAMFVQRHIQTTRALMDELMATCRECIDQAQETLAEPIPPVFKNLPPDVQVIIRQEPLKALDATRMRVIGKRMFFEFVMPTAQSVLINWEVGFYGLQRECANGEELFRAILPRYIEWFAVVERLIQLTVDLLPWGEHALHAHLPDLPAPAHALPEQTMVEIIQKTTPGVIRDDDVLDV